MASSELSQLCDPKESDGQGDFQTLSDASEGPSVTSSHLELEDSKLKAVNGDLSAAFSDVTGQNELVQQHMKVAEEAVTGWEKAEAEAHVLKEKLDVALQQKLATEDRVSHLDGALKECMKELRHVREEQEQKIHDAVVKKTREWEKIRTDLEANLTDVNNQLWDALAENKTMSKSLQERAKTITEITDIKTRVEAENNMLQVRLGVLEKENARFKYELHVLGKELEIRTEEREYQKKASESAGKQNLESVKKIVKLEEECQRLRLLVRKRLPSPGPMPQMKSEVDSLAKESSEKNRKRSPCRRTASSSFVQSVEAVTDGGLDGALKENTILSARLQTMEEETKSLKEMLAKRDQDLQAARLMCARTASKLSAVEEQLENLSSQTAGTTVDTPTQALGAPVEANFAREAVRAESWASALIAELAQFKKEKGSPVPDKIQDSLNIDLMDDFVEMEKLASLSPFNDTGGLAKFKETVGISSNVVTKHFGDLEGVVQDREQDFESIDQLCRELKDKLAYAEDQLNCMRSKQSENEATIFKLEQLLAVNSETQSEGTSLCKALTDGNFATEVEKDAEVKHPVYSGAACNKPCAESLCEKPDVWSTSCFPEDNISQVGAVVSRGVESYFSTVGSELAAAVRKVLDIVESVAQSDYTFGYTACMPEPDAGPTEASEKGENHVYGKLWRNTGLHACVESLVNLCNSFVKGKVDVIDFIAEMASALEWLVGLIFSVSDKSPSRICVQRHIQFHKGSPGTSDSEVTSVSPAPKATKSHEALPDQSSLSDVSSQFSELTGHDEELTKIRSEKADLKIKLDAEIRRADKFEHEILWLKAENGKLEHDYRLTAEKVEDLNKQIHEANKKLKGLNNDLLESECHASDLRSKLHETLEAKLSLENMLAKLQSAKQSLESKLHYAKENGKVLEEKLSALEVELREEIDCRKHIEIQFRELKEEQEKLRGGSTMEKDPENFGPSPDGEAARLKKEQDIAAAAEKLAECQQTILVLGKQLKALGAPNEAVELRTTEESPLSYKMSPSSHRLRSSSDRALSQSDVSDEMPYCSTEDRRASAVLGWSRAAKERRQEQGSIRSSRTNFAVNSPETEPGLGDRRGLSSERHGRQANPELHRGNSFPSPTHGDSQEGASLMTGYAMEAAVSSPLRSPARFLSLRNKNSNTQHGDSEPAEKHGSGFSRFFVRTKSGH